MENTTKKMPHLYLDMDGVQADFFGAWADKNNVPHWKAITNKENEIEDLANSSAKEVYEFFRNLRPLKGGMQVVKWAQDNKIPYTVLSAPLRGPYADASKQAKKDWLDVFHPGSSSNAIFTSQKQKYAVNNGVANVLVDDYGKYLNLWSGAGGIAVKHEDGNTEHTIKELEKIYKPFLNNK